MVKPMPWPCTDCPDARERAGPVWGGGKQARPSARRDNCTSVQCTDMI